MEKGKEDDFFSYFSEVAKEKRFDLSMKLIPLDVGVQKKVNPTSFCSVPLVEVDVVIEDNLIFVVLCGFRVVAGRDELAQAEKMLKKPKCTKFKKGGPRSGRCAGERI